MKDLLKARMEIPAWLGWAFVAMVTLDFVVDGKWLALAVMVTGLAGAEILHAVRRYRRRKRTITVTITGDASALIRDLRAAEDRVSRLSR